MQTRTYSFKKHPVLVPVLSVALLLSLLGNSWLLYKQTSSSYNSPVEQTKAIIAELQKTTTLPPGEPAILTVVDKTKLSNQLIAGNVENGDKILLYQQANKLIIYRPATHKLVTIFNLDNTATTSPSGTSPATR